MIDHSLINRSTTTAIQAIKNAQITDIDSLYLISDLLAKDHIDKLKEYINTNSSNWASDYNHRFLIQWDADSVVEELHEVCNNLTSTIINQFKFKNLNFLGIQLWRHDPGYTIGWHSDNKIINIALQIYLFDDTPIDYGTLFKYNNSTVNVPYVNNSGYLIVTKSPPGIEHCTPYVLPPELSRYALYSIWSLTEKIKEESHC
jgi:hypothetical protein